MTVGDFGDRWQFQKKHLFIFPYCFYRSDLHLILTYFSSRMQPTSCFGALSIVIKLMRECWRQVLLNYVEWEAKHDKSNNHLIICFFKLSKLGRCYGGWGYWSSSLASRLLLFAQWLPINSWVWGWGFGSHYCNINLMCQCNLK